MKKRKLGNTGPDVSEIGLGCMGMSDLYGPANEADGVATIRAALDAGITILDTGDYYGMGHNEMLIHEATKERKREDFVISVKFGAMRDPMGAWIGLDGRPVAVMNSLAYSLKRLGTDYIDIYRIGRVDPNVPIEETTGAIADAIKKGYVKHIGLSEAGVENIRKANSVHPICDLQIEYSLISRSIEEKILPACRELGIGITAYGVLSRGLLSGHWSKDRELSKFDFRAMSPRFDKSNIDHNLKLVDALKNLADAKSATVAQIAIAWVLSRGADIVPLVGSRKPEQLQEALGAEKIHLDASDLNKIEEVIPPGAAAGERYNRYLMSTLDSEK